MTILNTLEAHIKLWEKTAYFLKILSYMVHGVTEIK